MIFREPLLLLRRLVVQQRSAAVYDQAFHEGVNIIRGDNSSGKSTILDFIFFALGGDFTGWKPEASSCDVVLAEVEINAEILTLRRGVTDKKLQPMEIFWGAFEQAVASPFEGWEVHPFSRSGNKASFSQVLFQALKLPEVRSELSGNITMHQLLRLICVDQLSNVNSLLRDEQWDAAITRKTVGDLLFGLYDDQLYADELRLRDMERELARAKTEHASLREALLDTGQMVDVSEIDAQTLETTAQLDSVRKAIQDGQGSYEIEGAPAESLELQRVEATIRESKAEYASASRAAEIQALEVEDSEEFVENLRRRLSALDESIAAEKALGHLTLQLCPECLQPLGIEHPEGTCFLCKQTTPEDGPQQHIARLRNELSAQIQESENLLVKKRQLYTEQTRNAADALRALVPVEKRFADLVTRSRSQRDAFLDQLLEKKGMLEGRLSFLDAQRKLATRLADTLKRIGALQLDVEVIQRRITSGRSRQDEKRIQSEEVVSRIAVAMLKSDLPREDYFQVAQRVTVDFEKNICAVDGRSSFSASSISYLKAVVHFAIFFASLELTFFRYPKLIVNDNIEDKGMEEARSQNLQRLVVEYSSRATIRHQIIIATSMVDPSLDRPDLCVGPAYTRQYKTLRFTQPVTPSRLATEADAG